MKPNTQAMRSVAVAISLHDALYDQSEFGLCTNNPDEAGEGAACGSPCCIAGFAVQFLGTPEGMKKAQAKRQDCF